MLGGPNRPEFVAQYTIDDGLRPLVFRVELTRIPTQQAEYNARFTLHIPSEANDFFRDIANWKFTVWLNGRSVGLHAIPDALSWQTLIPYSHRQIDQFIYELECLEPGGLPVL